MIPKGSEVFVFNIPDNNSLEFGLLKGDDVIVEKDKYFSSNDLVILFNSDDGFIIRKFSKDIDLDIYSILGRIISLYRKI